MAKEYKTSYRSYFAWDYEQETQDLNKASEQGWQLVKGGCFHSRFVKNPDVRYRYQLDYRKIEDMGRYIETFREQGWEYVNSTFNGWHYFRKPYDPSLPEEAYEIFTDRESLQEMRRKWSRLAFAIGGAIAAFAIFSVIRVIRQPSLPSLIQMLVLLFESGVLLYGGFQMRKTQTLKKKNGSRWFVVFLAVILLGLASSLTLANLRPRFSTEQNAGSMEHPITDNRWVDFEVKYPDNYFLDLEMKADKPMTFKIIDEKGEAVFTKTETSFSEEDIRLRLSPGKYEFSLSVETGFNIKCHLQ